MEFAESVRGHDARAFAEHVQVGAVFVGDGPALRGRDAIVEGWKGVIDGKEMVLGWHPTSVIVTGDPHVAFSRGPFWIEITKANGAHVFLTGQFQSVWVQDPDGIWRVVVDGGGAPPAAATEADIAKLKASLPARCPTGGGM